MTDNAKLVERDTMSPAHDALDRMRRAYSRGTGCHLTADMIEALGRSMLAETWSEERPDLRSRTSTSKGEGVRCLTN